MIKLFWFFIFFTSSTLCLINTSPLLTLVFLFQKFEPEYSKTLCVLNTGEYGRKGESWCLRGRFDSFQHIFIYMLIFDEVFSRLLNVTTKHQHTLKCSCSPRMFYVKKKLLRKFEILALSEIEQLRSVTAALFLNDIQFPVVVVVVFSFFCFFFKGFCFLLCYSGASNFYFSIRHS